MVWGGIRWGTRGKLNAINSYYRELYSDDEITSYIAIAADESDRMNESGRAYIHNEYPLVKWEMTEQECLEYCYDHGWNWDENGVELYSVLDRVSCWCCRNKNLKELKNIYRYLSEYWQRLRGLQSRIDTPMKGPGKSVFQLEKRFESELNEDSESDW